MDLKIIIPVQFAALNCWMQTEVPNCKLLRYAICQLLMPSKLTCSDCCSVGRSTLPISKICGAASESYKSLNRRRNEVFLCRVYTFRYHRGLDWQCLIRITNQITNQVTNPEAVYKSTHTKANSETIE